jgi:type IV pilus assembly protein PilC
MKFEYQGRSENGQMQSGIVEASSREDAINVLKKNKIYVTFLEEKKDNIYSAEITFLQFISSKDMVLFSRQLAIMFQSGVPIVESLRSISKQTNKKKFKDQIEELAIKVESGESLSQALAAFPKTFNPFYVGMVRSGEASGRLAETLEYLADHLEQEHNFNSKIISSMIYPAFILVVMVGILILLVVFVLPGLEDVFADMDLPWNTRLILNSGDIFKQWWWVLALSIFVIAFLFRTFSKTPDGEKLIDNIVLKIPVIGEFVKKINLVRIAENISTLVAGGLPIVQALEVTAGVLSSNSYKEIMYEARDNVRRGEMISGTLIKYPKHFPVLFIQMIVVGEKTGNVDSSLKNVVSFYQGDVDRSLDAIVKMMEPAMIALVGGLVGFVVMSVLTPIYQISAV